METNEMNSENVVEQPKLSTFITSTVRKNAKAINSAKEKLNGLDGKLDDFIAKKQILIENFKATQEQKRLEINTYIDHIEETTVSLTNGLSTDEAMEIIRKEDERKLLEKIAKEDELGTAKKLGTSTENTGEVNDAEEKSEELEGEEEETEETEKSERITDFDF